MFGPLSFQEIEGRTRTNKEVPCFLCEDTFNIDFALPLFLRHVFDVHNLVIEVPQNIYNFNEYIAYWKTKFKNTPIEQILPAVDIASPETKYFFLSSLLPEDKKLRHKLKLQHTLDEQEFERNDSHFTRPCLFCKLNFEGKRYDYLHHLYDQHNLRLGNPENLVYIDELLSKIEGILKALQCLHCEKTFPDRSTLKDHMRKKQHKRINPSNRAYDKFYVVNYLDPDRQWCEKTRDFPTLKGLGDCENSDEEYGDWNEAEVQIVCLFCGERETDVNRLSFHMNSRHHFNFYEVTKHLDFYQKVKVVNYVRRQIYICHCICCDLQFESVYLLNEHMESDKHYCLPDAKIYNQPEFYFPTYENDTFLHFLEEIDD